MTSSSAPLRVAAAAALAAGLAACARRPAEDPPRLAAVAPSAGYSFAPTDVRVAGGGFRVEVYQTAGGSPRLDAGFRAWIGPAELEDVRWVSEGELRARVPAGLAAGTYPLAVRDPRGATAVLDPAFTVVDGGPPVLAVRATLVPALASVGQPVTLQVEVTNVGAGRADAVRPIVSVAGLALACPGPGPAPALVEVGAGATLVLDCLAEAPGSATATVGAEGTDPVTGAVVSAAVAASDTLLVQPPSALTAVASAAPVPASSGQLVAVEVRYENAAGAADVDALQPRIGGVVGAGSVTLLSAPGPCAVPGGGSCVATFVLQATLPGDVEVRVEAAGRDANSGAPVAAPRAAASLVVQRAPALSGRLLAAPLTVNTGQPVALALEVDNAGDVAVLALAPRLVAAPLGTVLVAPPPAPADVPAHGKASFPWTLAVEAPGPGAFVAQGEGLDANGAGTVTLAAVVSAEVTVEAHAALSARSAVAPRLASAGQPVQVSLAVVNSGQAGARVTPFLDAVATGSAGFVADPQPAATIAGGGTLLVAWKVIPSGAGTLALVPGVVGVDLNDGAAVAASDPAPILTVVRPAHLAARLAAPAAVTGGEPFVATVEVTNDGEAPAEDVGASLEVTGAATTLAGPTPPPPLRLAGGATVSLDWTLGAGAAPGTATLAAKATGRDGLAGTPLSAAAAPRSVDVQTAATLFASIVAAPARVNVGQRFDVRVRIDNTGQSAAGDVTVDVGCAACLVDAAPASTVVSGLGAVEVGRSFTAELLGTTAVTARAWGVDVVDGSVRVATTVARAVSIERPAALVVVPVGAASAPLSAFTIELEARNPVPGDGLAQATARDVRAGPLQVVLEPGYLGTADLSCAAEPAAPGELPAGGALSFRWTCAATAAGSVKLAAAVAGSDANAGDPLLASTTFVLSVLEAAVVIEDPFRDGTAFSFVFEHAGHVFLGPAGDGRGVVRCEPDGTGCASFAFRFWRDTTVPVFDPVLAQTVDTAVSLSACPDLVTLGGPPLCDENDPAATACFCGPDYESGRGAFGSFRLGPSGDAWLVAMGRSKKRLVRHLYATQDHLASPLRLAYVDLSVAAIPAVSNVEDVTAMAELNGRLYLGLQVDGAERPRLAILTRPPELPGLDATSADAFATTFQGTAMGERGAGVSQVDALLGFEGRLFVANRKAVLVSTTGEPTGDPRASTQFDECTPLAPATWAATSIPAYVEKIDVTPADKGVGGLAAWSGRLYLARATAAGVPELWVFTPRHDPGTGAFLGCAADRSDWRLVATTFGSAANTHLTALFASARYLYVGFDDVNGLQLWRTAAAQPAGEADFTGALGCAFGASGCGPVGGPGFGVSTNTRFFDARAISAPAGDQVWATVGSGSSSVRVYRVAE